MRQKPGSMTGVHHTWEDVCPVTRVTGVCIICRRSRNKQRKISCVGSVTNVWSSQCRVRNTG